MRAPSDRAARAGLGLARFAWRAPVLAAAVLAAALAAGPSTLLAAPTSGGAGNASSSSHRDLRDALLRRYEVSAVHNGVLLRPRSSTAAVREIEVSGDAVMVNGAHVSAEVLRSWILEPDAGEVLRLLELQPAERQALFGLKRDVTAAGVGAPAPPAAGAASAAAPAPSGEPRATDGDDDEARAGAPAAPSVPGVPPMPPVPGAAPVPPLAPLGTDLSTPPEPPSPAAPSAPDMVSSGSLVQFGHPVTVERNQIADQVMAIGGSVHVYGEVSHDVTAVGGSVRVDGRVGGDVKAVGGSVHLGPHAEVMGDVAAAGGRVVREPGSRVHGSLSDVGRWPSVLDGDDIDLDNGLVLLTPFGHSLRLFGSLAFLLLLLLAVSLVVLLAPNLLEEVRARIAGEPGTALAAGLLGQLLTGPALLALVVLLVITIVGCIFLVLMPLLVLAIFIAGLVGFAGAAYQLGRVLEHRFDRQPGGAFLTTVAGVVAIEIWSLIGHVLAHAGGMLHLVAAMFVLFGFAVRYLAWTIGFGAAILTAFANRPQRWRRGVPPGYPPGSSGGLPGPVWQTPPASTPAPPPPLPAAPGAGPAVPPPGPGST